MYRSAFSRLSLVATLFAMVLLIENRALAQKHVPLEKIGYTPCMTLLDGASYCDGIGYFDAPPTGAPDDKTFADAIKACQDAYNATYTQCLKIPDPVASANCQAFAYLDCESCIQNALFLNGWHP